MSATPLDRSAWLAALWEKAERQAKNDAALMYPPEDERKRREKEAELTVIYYRNMAFP